MRDATGATAAPDIPADSELYEILLRIRRDSPRRYEREVSAGMRRRVELYEEGKARRSSLVEVRAA